MNMELRIVDGTIYKLERTFTKDDTSWFLNGSHTLHLASYVSQNIDIYLFPNVYTSDFKNNFNKKLKKTRLPANITTIICHYYIQHISDLKLLDSIHNFRFETDYNSGPDDTTPLNNLDNLQFEFNIGQKLEDIIFPDDLCTIYFDPKTDQLLDNVKFPNNLRTIIFGCEFNQNLGNIKFPDSLHTIDFSDTFNYEYMQKLSIPLQIKEIIVHDKLFASIIKAPYGCHIRITS